MDRPIIFRGRTPNLKDTLNIALQNDNNAGQITFVFERRPNGVDLGTCEAQLLLNGTYLPNGEHMVVENTGLAVTASAGQITVVWTVADECTSIAGTGTAQFQFVGSGGQVWHSDKFDVEVNGSLSASAGTEVYPDVLTDHTARILALEEDKLDVTTYNADKEEIEGDIAALDGRVSEAEDNALNALLGANSAASDAEEAATSAGNAEQAALTAQEAAETAAGQVTDKVSSTAMAEAITTATNGLLYNGTYDSDTHVISFSVKGSETPFSVNLPIESLISNIALNEDDELVLTFEDGTTVEIDLSVLLTGVVKSVNGLTPDTNGAVTVYANIPYVQCVTAAATTIKEVTIAGLTVVDGTVVNVRMVFAHTGTEAAQLSLNGTVALIAINDDDVTVASKNCWRNGENLLVRYSSTAQRWQWLDTQANATATNHGSMSADDKAKSDKYPTTAEGGNGNPIVQKSDGSGFEVGSFPAAPSAMIGATAEANGVSGLVPQPLIADLAKVLSGAGTWVAQPTVPTDTIKYSEQTLEAGQKTQARANIGAGTSNFSGAYGDLTDKPTIPTVPTISTSITTDAASDTKTASPKAVKDYVDTLIGDIETLLEAL